MRWEKNKIRNFNSRTHGQKIETHKDRITAARQQKVQILQSYSNPNTMAENLFQSIVKWLDEIFGYTEPAQPRKERQTKKERRAARRALSLTGAAEKV